MSFYETSKVKLKVKSPIHIGSLQQKISRFEFLYNNGYIYPISENILAKFLYEKNLIDIYIKEIESLGNRFNLETFFKNSHISLTVQDYERLSNGKRIKTLTDISKMNDFRPFIRDGLGHLYIPGTSIKGVIRTAILYNVLKNLKKQNEKEFEKKIVERILKNIQNDTKRKNKKKLFQWGNEEFFENFVLGDKKLSPHTDWLKMFHVTDAYPKGEITTILIPINIIKKENERKWIYKKENAEHLTTIWNEVVTENAIFEFEMTWDRRLIEEFKRNNKNIFLPEKISEILNHIDNWAKDIFDFEKTFLKGSRLDIWYEKNKANFRIGFGSGMISTTIAMLLPETVRQSIRNYAGKNKGQQIAPKSRRVWINNTQPIPLGWAVLEVV